MPIFLWTCKECGKREEVVRSIADIDVGPDESVAIDVLPIEGEGQHVHCWERQISGGQVMVKSPNWGPGKGHWGKV